MIGAGEKHATSDHLAHNTTHAPDVDVFCITHAQDDFRRPVIPSYDVRRHHKSGAGRTSQTEVQYFQCTIGFNYNIAWFEILKREFLER